MSDLAPDGLLVYDLTDGWTPGLMYGNARGVPNAVNSTYLMKLLRPVAMFYPEPVCST